MAFILDASAVEMDLFSRLKGVTVSQRNPYRYCKRKLKRGGGANADLHPEVWEFQAVGAAQLAQTQRGTIG